MMGFSKKEIREEKERILKKGGTFLIKGIWEYNYQQLNQYLGNYKNPEIVSGNAKRADSFGEEYANEHGLKVTVFRSNWKQYRRAAGPIRNREMF